MKRIEGRRYPILNTGAETLKISNGNPNSEIVIALLKPFSIDNIRNAVITGSSA